MGLWLKTTNGEVVEINTDGLAEAPEDGKQYARKDAAWAEVEATDIDDAPEDGKQYARQDAAWSEVEAAEVLRGDPNNPPADWATDQLLYDGIEDDGSGGGGGPHDHDNYLPLAGGAITGDLQVDGSATVGGKEVSVSGHLHSQYAPTHDHPYAASSHTHNYAAPHDHPYAASSHSHNYAPTHDHPYAASSHTHSYSPTSHTHDKVGGLGLAGAAVPPSGAQIVRSGSNGYTYFGWINTVSGASTNEPSRIYTNSGGSDSFVRYMTPANFRAKVIDGNTISAANGTAGSPGFRFNSDTNTGMYRIGADQLGWSVGGKLRTKLEPTGLRVSGPNVGQSNKGWNQMQFVVMSESTSGSDSNNDLCGMSTWLQRGGLAPMMRVHKNAGEVLGFTNNANSAFVDIWAKGLTVNSSATTKRNIKTVQDDAVISLAEKWLMAEFDRQVGPLSVRIKPEAAVRQAALLEAGEELPPADTADYESVDHDCALDLCDGTPENPCPIIVNHRSEWGGIAEWWGEVAPQQVVFDEHGEATGIKLEQVAATALGAVGALSRRLTNSLDRIDILEARIEEMEGA